MATPFNLVAQLQIQGPGNLQAVVRRIQSSLNSITANVNVNIGRNTVTNLTNVNAQLVAMHTNLANVQSSATAAAASIQAVANALTNVRAAAGTGGAGGPINVNLKGVAQNAQQAATAMQDFGQKSALAIKRFLAFSIPATGLLGIVTAIKAGTEAAIEYDKQMIRLQQVTGGTTGSVRSLSDEIGRLSTSLGVSSKELSEISVTLASAGYAAKDVKIALETIAQTRLGSQFDDMATTVDGAIAAMQQFNLNANDLQKTFGSMTAVARGFAVESRDIVSAIQHTGGAFKNAGGNLEELMALFTSVRATTRESADSIATGFRTIFTRMERPKTLEFLREFGVNLQDSKGMFVGPYEAIKRLNIALKELDPRDVRYAQIIEELGGFRQVSKVIPLIQQFDTAQKALAVSMSGGRALAEEAAIAQGGLAVQITKVREEYVKLMREVVDSDIFRSLAGYAMTFAKALSEVLRQLQPLVPLLLTMGSIKGVSALFQMGSGMFGGKKFARGGPVPGTGSGDTVPALLTPGEFVIRKSAAQAFGHNNLAQINKYAVGGPVRRKLGIIGAEGHLTGQLDPERFQEKLISSTISNIIKQRTNETNTTLVGELATTIKKQLKLKRNIVPPTIDPNGLGAMNGIIFESTLRSLGAKFTGSKGGAIDFERGLGIRLATALGLPAEFGVRGRERQVGGQMVKGIPVEAKFNLENVSTENLQKKYERLYPVETFRSKNPLTPSDLLGSMTKKDRARLNLLSEKLNNPITGPYVKITGGGAQDELLRKYGLTIEDVKAKKFATGGNVRGTDTVPALLTPGEFVVNRESARSFGYQNLHKINKYAAGGPVGQSFNVGGGSIGTLAALGMIGSFAMTIADGNEKFKELLGHVTKLGIAFASVKLAMGTAQSIVGDRSGGAWDTTRRGVNIMQSGVAKGNMGRFKTGFRAAGAGLAGIGATAAIAGGAILAGDYYGNQSELAIKNRDEAGAVSASRKRDILSYAGNAGAAGAGIGAAFGPIGMAIGGLTGIIAGGLIGALKDNTQQIRESIAADKANEAAGQASDIFARLTGGKSLDRNADMFKAGGALKTQLSSIVQTLDKTKSGALTRQLAGQGSGIDFLRNELVSTSNNLEEFRSKIGGFGSTVIAAMAEIQGVNTAAIEEQIVKEINTRLEFDSAVKKSTSAMKEFQSTLNVMRQFSFVMQEVSEKTSQTYSNISAMSDVAGGKYGLAQQIQTTNSIGRAAGGFTGGDPALLKSELNMLFKNAGTEGVKMSRDTQAVMGLLQDLPNILRESMQSNLAASDPATAIRNALDTDERFKGTDIARLVEAKVGSMTTQGGGLEFGSKVRADAQKLAKEILGEMGEGWLKSIEELQKNVVEESKKFSAGLQAYTAAVMEADRRRIDIVKMQVSGEKSLATMRAAGRSVPMTFGEMTSTYNPMQGALLSGTGVANNVGAVGDEFRRVSLAISKITSDLNQPNLDFNKYTELNQQLAALNITAGKFRQYLENAGNQQEKLTAIQAKYGEATEKRNTKINFLDQYIYGSRDNQLKTRLNVGMTSRVMADPSILQRLPDELKQGIKGFMDMFHNVALPAFGADKTGKWRTGQQASDELRVQEVLRMAKGLNVADVNRQGGTNFQSMEDWARATVQKGSETPEMQAWAKMYKSVIDEQKEALKPLVDVPKTMAESIDKVLKENIALFNKSQEAKLVDAQRREIQGKLTSAEGGLKTSQQQMSDITRLEELLRAESRTRKGGEKELFGSITAGSTESFGKVQKLMGGFDKKQYDDLREKGVRAQSYLDRFTEKNKIVERNFGGRDKEVFKSGSDIFKEQLQLSGGLSMEERANRENLYKFSPKSNLTQLANLSRKYQSGDYGVGVSSEEKFTSLFNQNDLVKMLQSSTSGVKTTEVEKFKNMLMQGNAEEAARLYEEMMKTVIETQKGRKQTMARAMGFDPDQLQQFDDTIRHFGDKISAFQGTFSDIAKIEIDKVAKDIAAFTEEIKRLKAALAKLPPEAPTPPAGGFALGGSIFAPRGTDTVPAMLTPGEFVVNRGAAQRFLPLLKQINAQKFADGGEVQYLATGTQDWERDKAKWAYRKNLGYNRRPIGYKPMSERERYKAAVARRNERNQRFSFTGAETSSEPVEAGGWTGAALKWAKGVARQAFSKKAKELASVREDAEFDRQNNILESQGTVEERRARMREKAAQAKAQGFGASSTGVVRPSTSITTAPSGNAELDARRSRYKALQEREKTRANNPEKWTGPKIIRSWEHPDKLVPNPTTDFYAQRNIYRGMEDDRARLLASGQAGKAELLRQKMEPEGWRKPGTPQEEVDRYKAAVGESKKAMEQAQAARKQMLSAYTEQGANLDIANSPLKRMLPQGSLLTSEINRQDNAGVAGGGQAFTASALAASMAKRKLEQKYNEAENIGVEAYGANTYPEVTGPGGLRNLEAMQREAQKSYPQEPINANDPFRRRRPQTSAYARGGIVGSDTVTGRLTPGEYVLNKQITQRLAKGGEVQYLQNGGEAAMTGGSYQLKLDPETSAIFNTFQTGIKDFATQLKTATDSLTGFVGKLSNLQVTVTVNHSPIEVNVSGKVENDSKTIAQIAVEAVGPMLDALKRDLRDNGV